ncbi:hypothetical protein BC829DRAFT_434909 [Chytridium lagenaria]|nr:hypothetical protein BC829DRAFT_434909 [Chytridium lagenaria]
MPRSHAALIITTYLSRLSPWTLTLSTEKHWLLELDPSTSRPHLASKAKSERVLHTLVKFRALAPRQKSEASDVYNYTDVPFHNDKNWRDRGNDKGRVSKDYPRKDGGKVNKTRPKLTGSGIPENARLFQIKAGRDLPSITERSNGIISEFRATCAIFGVPLCQENLSRFIRNQRPKGKGQLSEPYLNDQECRKHNLTILDPRATVGQHQKVLSGSMVSTPRPSPSREDPVSKKTPATSLPDSRCSDVAGASSGRYLSSVSSPIDEDEVVHPSPGDILAPRLNKLKAGLKPATSEHPKGKGKEPLLKHEYDEVFLRP